MTRLLIADDHPIVREGLRRIVEDAPGGGITVVGEASDGDELLAQAGVARPDVVQPLDLGHRGTDHACYSAPIYTLLLPIVPR